MESSATASNDEADLRALFLSDATRRRELWESSIKDRDLEADRNIILTDLVTGVFDGIGISATEHAECLAACIRGCDNLLTATGQSDLSFRNTCIRKVKLLHESNMSAGAEWVLNAILLVPTFIFRQVRPYTGKETDMIGVFVKNNHQYARMATSILEWEGPYWHIQLKDLPDDQKAVRYEAPKKRKKETAKGPTTEDEPQKRPKMSPDEEEATSTATGKTKTTATVISRKEILTTNKDVLARMDPFSDDKVHATDLDFVTEQIIRVLPASHRRNIRQVAKEHHRKDIMDWCVTHKDTDEERIEFWTKLHIPNASEWELKNPARVAHDQLDEILKQFGQKEGGKAWQMQQIVNRLRTYEEQYDSIWDRAIKYAVEVMEKAAPRVESQSHEGDLIFTNGVDEQRVADALARVHAVVNPGDRDNLPSHAALEVMNWLLKQVRPGLAAMVESRVAHAAGKQTQSPKAAVMEDDDDDGVEFVRESAISRTARGVALRAVDSPREFGSGLSWLKREISR